MTVLGHWMIVVAFATSVIAVIGFLGGSSRFGLRFLRPSLLTFLSALFLILASIVLLIQLLTHDFSNGYVFSYSDRSLPFLYLVSSFYAGQEGSFLFWSLCSGIIALLLLRSLRDQETRRWTMAIFMTVQSIILLIIVAKSPFRSLWEMFAQAIPDRVPVDGRGLNPLLQNFWMVIHPPVLFLGFAGMTVPFSLSLAGLIKGDSRALVEKGLPYILAASLVLGLGIMLGAYWAYGVLGWGGYWGWDPVENSSLVPWLTSVALIHTLLAQRRTGKYVRTSFVLALVTFLLVVYSTFLTRSGILGDASVHAFSDPGATTYWMLLVLLGAIAAVSVAALIRRWKQFRPESVDLNYFSRESILGYGAIVLGLAAAVVLFGTSLPIFSTTRVEPAFYDSSNLPLVVVMLLLIGLSLLVQWKYQEGMDLFRRSLRSLSISVIAGIGFYLAGVRELRFLLLVIAAMFTLIVNIEVAIRVAKENWRILGGKIAHVGLALFLLGVVTTGRYATTARVVLPLGSPQKALGRTLTYTGERVRPDGKTAFAVRIDDGTMAMVLEPVMFDAGEQGIMKNPDIASSLTQDFYLSPLSYENLSDPPETYEVRKGQRVDAGDAAIEFVEFQMKGDHNAMAQTPDGGVTVGAVLAIDRQSAHETLVPTAIVRPGKAPDYSREHSALLGADIQLAGMNIGSAETSEIRLLVERTDNVASSGSLVVEASVKPFISLLWFGTVAMFLGFGVAIVHRTKEDR